MGSLMAFFTNEVARYLNSTAENFNSATVQSGAQWDGRAVAWWESELQPKIDLWLEELEYGSEKLDPINQQIERVTDSLRVWDDRTPDESVDTLASRATMVANALTDINDTLPSSIGLTADMAPFVAGMAVEIEAADSGFPETTWARWELFKAYASDSALLRREPGELLGEMWRRGIDRVPQDEFKANTTRGKALINANIAMIEALSKFDNASFDQASDVEAARMLRELHESARVFESAVSEAFGGRGAPGSMLVEYILQIKDVTRAAMTEAAQVRPWERGEIPRPREPRTNADEMAYGQPALKHADVDPGLPDPVREAEAAEVDLRHETPRAGEHRDHAEHHGVPEGHPAPHHGMPK